MQLSGSISSDRLSGDNRHGVAGQLMNPLYTFCSFVTPAEWKQMGQWRGKLLLTDDTLTLVVCILEPDR